MLLGYIKKKGYDKPLSMGVLRVDLIFSRPTPELFYGPMGTKN